MTENELLHLALHSSATIQQPHALKAYLAAKNIYSINSNEEIWEQVHRLILKSEIKHLLSFSNQIDIAYFSKRRIQSILNRGIYPVAYGAMFQWHNTDGFNDIFNHYLEKASLNNEYLSHNITILLAFYSIRSQLEQHQISPFLDRLTEFVTSTFKDGYQHSASLMNNLCLSNEDLLQQCLKQPSFFGHNLITLAWLMRFENIIPSELLKRFKFNLYLQATNPLEDPDDEMRLDIFQQCTLGNAAQFIGIVHQLVFSQCKNLHQVTLADALLYLQQQFSAYTIHLKQIAEYQVRILNLSE